MVTANLMIDVIAKTDWIMDEIMQCFIRSYKCIGFICA